MDHLVKLRTKREEDENRSGVVTEAVQVIAEPAPPAPPANHLPQLSTSMKPWWWQRYVRYGRVRPRLRSSPPWR